MKANKSGLGKKSNIKKIAVFLIVIMILCCAALVYLFISWGDVSGESKNIATTDAIFSLAGKKGGFIYKDKYYAKGKSVTLGGITSGNKIGSNVFYFAADGESSFTIKGKFGKQMTKPSDKKQIAFYVQTYNSKGVVLESKNTLVKSSTHSLTINSRRGINYVKISLSKAGTVIYTIIAKVGNLPTIEHQSLSGATRNSAGEYVIKTPGEVNLRFKFTYESGHTLYYRWFTYKDYTMSASNINSTNKKCVPLTGNTTVDYPMNVNRKRGARIRVYSSLANCTADDNSVLASPTSGNTNRKVMKEFAVKYRPNNTVTNSDGYIVPLHYNKATIGKTIGSQTKSQCKLYAYKYAYYIKYGKTTTGYNPICKTYSSMSNLLSIIKNNIDNGSSTMVFFSNNYGEYKQHWGVAVGYKPNKSNEVTHISQILFLDPYSSVGYGKKGENVLWSGRIFDEKGNNIHSTMLRFKNSTYCYVG